MSPTVLDFDPGDVAQVDFGRGSTIEDVFTEQAIATWNFVTMLPVHLCYTPESAPGQFSRRIVMEGIAVTHGVVEIIASLIIPAAAIYFLLLMWRLVSAVEKIARSDRKVIKT